MSECYWEYIHKILIGFTQIQRAAVETNGGSNHKYPGCLANAYTEKSDNVRIIMIIKLNTARKLTQLSTGYQSGLQEI